MESSTTTTDAALFSSASHEALRDVRNGDEASDADEGIVMEEGDEEGDEASSKREDPEACHPRESAAQEPPSQPSSNMFGDFGVFRDFFLAAFSDGYYNVRIIASCMHLRL